MFKFSRAYQVLAYLAYHRTWLSREHLAFIFWPDKPAGVAKRNLRKVIHQLHSFTWLSNLEVSKTAIRWLVTTDCHNFSLAYKEADYHRALQHYGEGVFLKGFDKGSLEFSRWLHMQREQFYAQWREVILEISARATTKELIAKAENLLRIVLHEDAFDEEVLRALIRLMIKADKPHKAFAAYQGFSERLRQELVLAPSLATKELIESIQGLPSLRNRKLRLALLGEASVYFQGKSERLTRKEAAMLCYLALEGETSRAILAELLWPKSTKEQARTNLRKTISSVNSKGKLLTGQDPLNLLKIDVDLYDPIQNEEPFKGALLSPYTYEDCKAFASWLKQKSYVIKPSRQTLIPLSLLRPPLVGREHMWDMLEAASKDNKIIILKGEAGMGKTRLAQDFLGQKGQILSITGSPTKKNSPYATIMNVVWKTHNKTSSLDDWVCYELSRVVPELSLEKAPPLLKDHQTRFYRAFAQAFEIALKDKQALFFDDLHYWDESSVKLGWWLLDKVHKTRLPIVLALRPESSSVSSYVDQLLLAGKAHLIDVPNLTLRDLNELLANINPSLAIKLTGETLYELSQGIPFYVTQALKALHHDKQLPKQADQLMTRRFDQLSPLAQHILWAMSLIGGECDLELIAAMLGESILSLTAGLKELEDARFLRHEKSSHGLMSQAVRRSIPAALKHHLHKRAANYLEAQAEGIKAAEHWLAIEEVTLAGRAWQSAANSLMVRGLPEEAKGVLERALDHAADGPEKDRLLLTLARSFHELGRTDEAKAITDEFTSIESPDLRAKLLHLRADLTLSAGDLLAARDLIAEGKILAECLQNQDTQKEFTALEEFLAYSEGRFHDAIALAKARLTEERKLGAKKALILSNLGVYYRNLGELDTSMIYQQEARCLANKLGAKQQEFSTLANLAGVYHFKKDVEKALELNQAALSMGRFYGYEYVLNNKASQLVELGRVEEAIEVAKVLSQEAENLEVRVFACLKLAKLYSLKKQQKNVEYVLNEAITLLRGLNSVIIRAHVVVDVHRYGSSRHIEAVKGILDTLTIERVPHELREDLEVLKLKNTELIH